MCVSGRWLLWTACVFYSTLHNAAVRVSMRESRLEVVQGESVTMPCSFFTTSPLSRLNIIWTLAPFSDPDTPSQVIAYDHGQVIEDPSLTGRVGFAGIPWSADVVLNDTRLSDAGTYRCLVSNPPETGDPGIGEVALTVLAPPSLPLCQWEGDPGGGGSITLSCSVEEGGFPPPEMSWDKLQPEEVSLSINIDGEQTGSVQIANLSVQSPGVYRCSVSNLLGTQTCYVSLAASSTPDSSPGVLQGTLLSLAMALVLLALVLLLLWLLRSGRDEKSRREGKEDECYNEIKDTPSVMKRSFV